MEATGHSRGSTSLSLLPQDGASPGLDHCLLYCSSLSALHHFMTLFNFPFTAHREISHAHFANVAAERLLTCHQEEVRGHICTCYSLCIPVLPLVTPSLPVQCQLSSPVLGALSALGWVCGEALPLPPRTISLLLSLPVSLHLTRPPEPVQQHVEWGPLLDHCLSAHWSVILYTLRWLHGKEGDSTR